MKFEKGGGGKRKRIKKKTMKICNKKWSASHSAD